MWERFKQAKKRLRVLQLQSMESPASKVVRYVSLKNLGTFCTNSAKFRAQPKAEIQEPRRLKIWTWCMEARTLRTSTLKAISTHTCRQTAVLTKLTLIRLVTPPVKRKNLLRPRSLQRAPSRKSRVTQASRSKKSLHIRISQTVSFLTSSHPLLTSSITHWVQLWTLTFYTRNHLRQNSPNNKQSCRATNLRKTPTINATLTESWKLWPSRSQQRT
jgi:hypothetical protein